ncbi:uncharacterized protein KGF55_001600 [Candida pseudojiufengensis]|uniref:uncharacterized protein n=1 Tax=Candida pseudojiufengensis TaxID=497109 RepID=UPI0022241B0F|nr:uncharacterized protein KGF55_001600 [Candida pseudojiufengensis]KAI5965379.1 hypothetical protein KGF55_001600 [Candida pseudojiufengensis]
MEIFLKLPKEILSLIFSNIQDISIIKNLIYIPGLQHIALERKYPKFEINDDQNKSIETLKGLFQSFKFIPSLIIGNVKQINQLINEPNFKSVNYEVKILEGTSFTDLFSISNKVYIVGLHLDQYLEHFVGNFKNNEIKSFLNFIESTFLQSLTISHFNIFPIQFPKSLKELTLDKGHKIKLDISDLHHLESFDCKNLRDMISFDALQLPPLSLKNLRVYSCGSRTLGDLSKYKNLKLLHISCCPELFGLVITSFPDSLENLNIISNFHPQRTDEVFEEEQFNFLNFSDFGSRIRIDADFRFPPNLKNLRICDIMKTLEIGNIQLSNKLNCLKLNGIGSLDLAEVLDGLPRKMSEIIITNCWVPAEGYLHFPESKRIKLINNDLCYGFLKSNLNQLKSLMVLDMSDNYCSDCGPKHDRLDPLNLLTNLEEHVRSNYVFNSPNLQNLILKSSKPMDYEYISSFQVSFKCENLTNLKMINLEVKSLDLNKLHNASKELIINTLKLETIQGNFSRFSNLKKLDLENNQVTFSMLSSQNFPSGLTHLNLSNNKIEDLSCLVLDNCIHLKDLKLKKVTPERTPEGAIQLINSLFYVDPHIDAILTNYETEVIFEIINGVEIHSFLKSNYKKRRIC